MRNFGLSTRFDDIAQIVHIHILENWQSGQALAEALIWKAGKNLSHEDEQFIDASQELALVTQRKEWEFARLEAQIAQEKLIATASSDGTARIWQVEGLGELLARGCTWLQDYLATHPEAREELQVCDFRERGTEKRE